jgi:hypothetical protein
MHFRERFQGVMTTADIGEHHGRVVNAEKYALAPGDSGCGPGRIRVRSRSVQIRNHSVIRRRDSTGIEKVVVIDGFQDTQCVGLGGEIDAFLIYQL